MTQMTAGFEAPRVDATSSSKATVLTYRDEFAIQEVRELAKAAGYKVEALITQKQVVKSEFGIGVGKAQEVAQMMAENGSRLSSLTTAFRLPRRTGSRRSPGRRSSTESG